MTLMDYVKTEDNLQEIIKNLEKAECEFYLPIIPIEREILENEMKIKFLEKSKNAKDKFTKNLWYAISKTEIVNFKAEISLIKKLGLKKYIKDPMKKIEPENYVNLLAVLTKNNEKIVHALDVLFSKYYFSDTNKKESVTNKIGEVYKELEKYLSNNKRYYKLGFRKKIKPFIEKIASEAKLEKKKINFFGKSR
ncbi:MAG: hypothetical protein ACTSXL_00555 [Alphaproteobacteria bacterium]|nr:MAG: hypothetical protein B6I23_02055 [Rickettsiaceae bacterium 4572_127]